MQVSGKGSLLNEAQNYERGLAMVLSDALMMDVMNEKSIACRRISKERFVNTGTWKTIEQLSEKIFETNQAECAARTSLSGGLPRELLGQSFCKEHTACLRL